MSFFLIGLCASSFASPELDRRYGFRKIVVSVINSNQYPVVAEHIENEFGARFRKEARFSIHDTGYLLLKERMKSYPGASFENSSSPQVSFLEPSFQELSSLGVQGVVAVEIIPQGDEAELRVVTFALGPTEILRTTSLNVTRRQKLESYTDAVENGFSEVGKMLPYDASILKRYGYRVVIDRGHPKVRLGMQIPVMTFENFSGKLVLEETGLIKVTQVEPNYAFGKILVDRKPRTIEEGNKIVLALAKYPNDPVIAPIEPFEVSIKESDLSERGLASEPVEESPIAPVLGSDLAFRKGRFGRFDFFAQGNFLTWNRTVAATRELVSSSAMYPGANFRGELWLTNHFFLELGFGFGMGSLTTATGTTPSTAVPLNSQVNMFSGAAGYRVGLLHPEHGPKIHAKLGLARHQFQVDDSSDPTTPVSARYSGVLGSVGSEFPINDAIGLGLDFNALLFSSLQESPETSGAENVGVTGWEIALRGFYNLTQEINLELKFSMQSFGSGFSGQGTRSVAFSSSSQSSKNVALGLNYFF